MKKIRFAVLAVSIITLCCAKGPDSARNAEFEGALKVIDSVYADVFKILSEGKNNPEDAMKKADAAVKAAETKLKAASAVLKNKPTLEQQSLLMDFNKDLVEKSEKPAAEFLGAIKKSENIRKNLIQLFASLNSYHEFK